MVIGLEAGVDFGLQFVEFVIDDAGGLLVDVLPVLADVHRTLGILTESLVEGVGSPDCVEEPTELFGGDGDGGGAHRISGSGR